MGTGSGPRRMGLDGEKLERGLRALRAPFADTPARLWLTGAVLIVAAAVFAVLAATSVNERGNAADSAANETEPLMSEAVGLYAALSDADATAATTFLTGGLESPDRRRRYLADLRVASERLTTLTPRVRSAGAARAAAQDLGTQLHLYAGQIETARANNRQRLPVGAAYLRRASTLMREQMLPAAKRIYALEARRLADNYHTGTADRTLLMVVAGAVVLLAVLLAAQVYIARLTHRFFNVPLVAATAIIVGLTSWILIAFVIEQNSLAAARDKGSDSVQVLSAMRILALRAQADESLSLVARGGGQEHLADFDAVMEALLGDQAGEGLTREAAAVARRTGSSDEVAALAATLDRYRMLHEEIAAMEANGDFDGAIRRAVAPGAKQARVSEQLNAELGKQITSAQERFDAEAADATSALKGLWIAIPLLVTLATGLGLLGLRARIVEYR